MATTQEVQDKAKELGERIADHQATRRLEEAAKALDNDADAQRVMNRFNEEIQKLAEKQQRGQPIEVQEKQALQQVQTEVATNLKVQNLQRAQMDYLDLVRQAFVTVTEQAGGGPSDSGQGPGPAAGGISPGPLAGGGMMGPGPLGG